MTVRAKPRDSAGAVLFAAIIRSRCKPGDVVRLSLADYLDVASTLGGRHLVGESVTFAVHGGFARVRPDETLAVGEVRVGR